VAIPVDSWAELDRVRKVYTMTRVVDGVRVGDTPLVMRWLRLIRMMKIKNITKSIEAVTPVLKNMDIGIQIVVPRETTE
jgi:hypothetical protein